MVYHLVPLQEAGEILLCEHDPVYTFGLRDTNEYAEKAERLRKLGAEAFKVQLDRFDCVAKELRYSIFTCIAF